MKPSRDDLFWAKVRRGGPDECWKWLGAKGNGGYGLFFNGERLVPAHRWIYERIYGAVPKELSLDHLCRTRDCVNTRHLEPVTTQVNLLRGVGKTAKNAQKTQCPKGHPYEGDNLYIDQTGRRHCRECGRVTWRAWNERRTSKPSTGG